MVTRIEARGEASKGQESRVQLPLAFTEMEMELGQPFSEAFPRLLFFHGPMDIAYNFILSLFYAWDWGSCIPQEDALILSSHPHLSLPSIGPGGSKNPLRAK